MYADDLTTWPTHFLVHEQSLTSRSTATVLGSTSVSSLPTYVLPCQQSLKQCLTHITQAGYCSSFEECRSATGGSRGFNVALGIAPKTSDTDKFCDVVYCGADDADMCQDAYLYPTDSKKARRCANTTDFDVVFCPESKDALVTLMTTENSEFDLEGTVQVPAEVPGGSTSTVEGSAVSTTTSIDFVTNQDGDAALNGIDFGTGSTASDTNGAVEGFDDTATRTPATTSASLTLTFAESPSAEIDSVDAQVETEGEAALTTKTSLRH